MFIGQAPNSSGDGTSLLTGRCGRRIAACFGLSWFRFLRCRRVNLNASFGGKAGKGDAFDRQEGRRTVAALMPMLPQKVVLLGKSVASCFGVRGDFLATCAVNGSRFLLFPHPSGVSRWWNDPRNRRKAARAARRFLAS